MLAPSSSTRSIARQTGLKIALYIVAAALIGAALPQAGLAEDAESGSLHDGAKSGPAADQGDSRPATTEDHTAGGTKSDNHAPAETGAGLKPPDSAGSQDNSRANEAGGKQNIKDSGAKGDGVKGPMATERSSEKDISSTRSRARDANPIDTSITVQPRRPFGRPNKPLGWKPVVGSVSPRNLLGRHAHTPGAIDHVRRNAIGMPVVRQETGKSGDREPNGVRTTAPVSAVPGNPAKADVGFDRRTVRQSNPNAPVVPATPNRAVIDGTKLVRPSTAASGLGGPRKTVTGIRGTAIRPKH
jgi:hypothetical protein